jgi:hypothetical protein
MENTISAGFPPDSRDFDYWNSSSTKYPLINGKHMYEELYIICRETLSK